ncbi:MAG: hypothetical protein QOJ92_999 [Frankiales bacterium]|nr:hypothetical protein [Frankiales bacterium]
MPVDHDRLLSGLRFYERFVRYCEADAYPLTGDDYTNELSTRDWLDENLDGLTAPDQERLAALDERYRASTVDDGGELLRRFHNPRSLGWWWLRRPRAAGDQLHEDWGVPLNPEAD